MSTHEPPGVDQLPALHEIAGRIPLSYGSVGDFERHLRWQTHKVLIDGAKRICDVGAGAKPSIGLGMVQRYDLDYLILDASQDELDRAPAGYRMLQADILDSQAISEEVSRDGPFDAVFSRWTAEHIPDGRRFHEAVFSMLRPGGRAVHMFPTLYTPPFVVNRLLAEGLSRRLLFRVYPEREVKFPALYSWCRGPTRRQLRRLEHVGFSIEHYFGFFGHNFYASIRPLHRAQQLLTRTLIEHPVPQLTSFALVVLRRPE
jgi:SAM-dependent methyltransferase